MEDKNVNNVNGNNNQVNAGKGNKNETKTCQSQTMKDITLLKTMEGKIKGLQKRSGVLLIIIIVIAVLSTLALCRSLSAFHISSTAFLGWTVTVLSMLVVVLMGWHIFSVLDLKEYRDALKNIPALENNIDKIDKQVQAVKQEFGKKIADIESQIEKAIAVSVADNIHELERKYSTLYIEIKNIKGLIYENIDIRHSLTCYLSAIEEAIESGNPAIGIIDRMLTLLRNRTIEVENAMKSIFLFDSAIVNRIMEHRNFNAISDRFKDFIKQIDKDRKFYDW